MWLLENMQSNIDTHNSVSSLDLWYGQGCFCSLLSGSTIDNLLRLEASANKKWYLDSVGFEPLG